MSEPSQVCSHLGNAVGTARMIGGGHEDFCAKVSSRFLDTHIICSDENTVDILG
jgi:hypothetical protein